MILSSSLSPDILPGDLLVSVNGRRVLDNEERLPMMPMTASVGGGREGGGEGGGEGDSDKYFDDVLGVIGKVSVGTSKVGDPPGASPYITPPHVIPPYYLLLISYPPTLLSP